MDEQKAIQRLKANDISGLEFLVMCYQVKAVRTAYLITQDIGLAEDVVQDSFLQAYHSIHGFDEARPFGPWFMRSVVNASVKLMQKSARQVPLSGTSEAEDDADDLFSQLAEQAESVESQVESLEVQSQIWDAMQKLSPRQRAVVVQRYFLDMSEGEMAQESGVATGTIKWLLNAARERLRSLLAGRSEE